MWDALSLGLTVAAGVVSIPVAVFGVEVLAARNPSRPSSRPEPARAELGSAAIVIPAHNESAGILPTLADLSAQLEGDDRLVVVADNCSDDTGAVAASAGAEVIRRDDLSRIGKGYALAFGIDHLAARPPRFVIFVDADCRVSPGAIAQLRAACAASGRPVQAAYLMRPPARSAVDHRLAEFAWIVKNWVRPLGLWRLGGPVQLMGAGMVFAWNDIRAVPLSSGHLVEDLKLGLDLALLGKPPSFLPSATVTSEFPATASGAETQRQRWVRGHLGVIAHYVPRLVWRALARRSPALLVMALDLAVPPLSLLIVLALGMVATSAFGVAFGASPASLALAAANCGALSAALAVAWGVFGGRALTPVATPTPIGLLIWQKCKFYGRLLLGKTSRQWIRTDRSR
jgi:cellulose synthase/poly-beta-1,6-N-acetylglucosamine synthase-like glycosyltransferase